MESSPSNFEEMFVSGTKEYAGRCVWSAFIARPRSQVEVSVGPSQDAYWQAITPLLKEVGPNPLIVISQLDGQAVRRSLHLGKQRPPGLRVEYRRRDEVGGSYIATVEGVDVFSARFVSGVAWLFSAYALQRIKYAKLDNSGHHVDVAFDVGEEQKGSLRLRFRQHFDWANTPTVEIRSPKLSEKS